VRFHLNVPLPRPFLAPFSPPPPFPIHVRLLATSPNDGLKQTPVLLRNSEQCIGKLGSVGSRPIEPFILYRWSGDGFL
jgi:hypothetical protein